MKEFFYGWRRKTAVGALLVTCLLTQAWLRSIYHPDHFGFWYFGKWSVIASEDHYLIWGAQVPSSILWRHWRIPYWLLVLPLTLLSIYLLLWGPRKRM